MNNELLLLSGQEIPFLEAQLVIHVPSAKEISLIGEESFWSGCQFLNFSKSLISDKDKIGLDDMSDFEVFMSIMCSNERVEYKNNVLMVLTLLFPMHQIKFTPAAILLIDEKNMARIDETNFDIFKDIIISAFDLQDLGAGGGYNPEGERAKKIAEKLQRARNKKTQGEHVQKVAVLSRYISILAVGGQKNINDLMEYTVFQLKDEFKRFQMKQAFDINIKAKLAGAKDLDEVDNWMDEIHS